MTGCSRLVAMELIVMAIALGCTTPAVAQDIPPDALHCNLRSPPETAAKGVRSAHKLPVRLFPVAPGETYTGCQWIWIAYTRPDVWDYASVTFYENGNPRIQRINYPPLPVQVSVQRCLFGADGSARKMVEGSDWRLECDSARHLKDLLLVVPKENAAWDFL